MKTKFFPIMLAILLIGSVLTGCILEVPEGPQTQIVVEKGRPDFVQMAKFESGQDLLDAFEEGRNRGGYMMMETDSISMPMAKMSASAADVSVGSAGGSGREYSETNIQVEGVDEADIIKTDGDYIYTLANNQLVIVEAYPVSRSKILSTTKMDDFYPQELFIHDDKLLVFGSANYRFDEEVGKPKQGEAMDEAMSMPYRRYISMMSARLYDISDKASPQLARTVDFEGGYLTSRKIGSEVYLVVNNYPHYYDGPICEDILPLYRDTTIGGKPSFDEMMPMVSCLDVGYIEPLQADNFITIASISMIDDEKRVEKQVIVGSGQNVYASLDNMYIAQTSWPNYGWRGEPVEDDVQKTVITKLGLYKGEIGYLGTGEVKGHILNQFSMDEYDEHFRIATTSGNVWDSEKKSSNNIYVLDEDMDVVGSLEDLAPGEKIYSVRFMGKKGYVVTFKKVDPLFVIDLSDPRNPDVLGKLKIPGYSDYLHPFDENHIIGIGKDTVEAEEDLKSKRQLDFAWYQGIKMAVFDVSDVENPIEMHKIVIGDRGTNSEALHNHKAFLFDRERELLILPITLAEIKGEKSADNQHGDYTFQGAYVYDLSLEDGFNLRGRVTHYDDDEAFKKSGYYFRGDSAIRRSLYIEDVLYTLSDNRLQLNDLDDLERLNVLEFEDGDEENYPRYY